MTEPPRHPLGTFVMYLIVIVLCSYIRLFDLEKFGDLELHMCLVFTHTCSYTTFLVGSIVYFISSDFTS